MDVPAFHGPIGFNAHHSPMGAYFTFTCGHFGTRGGLAAQLGKPGNQDLFIGVKEGDRYTKAPLRCLPFYEGADASAATAFTPEVEAAQESFFAPYGAGDITRHYGYASDRWKTPHFEFTIYSPFGSIPDPTHASPAQLRDALLPAVTGELVIDNRAGTTTRTGFFAITFNEGGARILDQGLIGTRVGFALRANLGVAGEVIEIAGEGRELSPEETSIRPFLFMRWDVREGLEDKSNPVHLLGITPGLGVEVPAGKKVILRLALGCHLTGVVTTLLEGSYLYSRLFSNLQDVLNEALTRFPALRAASNVLDDKLLRSGVSCDQQFLIAHSVRSYYGNTQLLEVGGQPYWIVNEGEYCMMNTLDLAVDQMFWELELNPWVMRNLLDNFVRYYSYDDQVKDEHGERLPGGISFCHDQGAHNQFSPFTKSAYELKDLAGCFSYMTQEELCNWILMAASYVVATGDEAWAKERGETLQQCYSSMIARRKKEGGFMELDTALCGTGSEITTYDSLDASLGQARSNIYLAVKCWAAYLGLRLLSLAGADTGGIAHLAGREIEKLEHGLAAIVQDREVFPAIAEAGHKAFDARILPAAEGLLYAMFWNRAPSIPSGMKRDRFMRLDRSSPLESALLKHLVALLSDVAGRNHFADHGIRLSSTSNNSWLSKIAIIQHVARSLFNLDEIGQTRPPNAAATGWEKADAAHVAWLTNEPSAYWAASDQIVNGVAKGSKYYPRLITTALWFNETQNKSASD